MCQGVASRVLRVVFNGVAKSKENGIHFQKDVRGERCYVVYWDDKHLKKMCVYCQPLKQAVPIAAELVCLARFVCRLQSQYLPMCFRGTFLLCRVRYVKAGRMIATSLL